MGFCRPIELNRISKGTITLGPMDGPMQIFSPFAGI